MVAQVAIVGADISVSSDVMGDVSVSACVAKGHKSVAWVQWLLPALSLLCFAVVIFGGCGGQGSPARDSVGDGSMAALVEAPAHKSMGHNPATGAQLTVEAEPATATPLTAEAEPPAVPRSPPRRGHIQIMARWLWPASEYRRSPGRNACGQARPSPLHVEVMGGLRDVAVSASSGPPPGPARFVLARCGLEPRMVVLGLGQSLSIQSLSTQPAEVIVERVGAGGIQVDSASRKRFLPLRLPGQRYDLVPKVAGLLRLHTRRDPNDFVYALVARGAAAVTGVRGFAELELPAGHGTLALWHPPIAAKALRATVSVLVPGQGVGKTIVDLAR